MTSIRDAQMGIKAYIVFIGGIPQNARANIYPVVVKMLGLRFSSQAELI